MLFTVPSTKVFLWTVLTLWVRHRITDAFHLLKETQKPVRASPGTQTYAS